MADEMIYASRRDRRRAQRKSHNAATAGRASAVALTTFGLVLTGGVAANASAGGPEQNTQSATVQYETPEVSTEHTSHIAADAHTAQHAEPQPAEQQASGDFTTASSGVTQTADSGEGNSSVLGAAYSVIGSPYSWGGTTPGGFDCSGFINWVYDQAGEGDLPRTTTGMEAALPQVSEPEPGDIVLANGSTHGGIYVGNGQVVSATTSSGVSLHGMDEDWHQVNAILSPN